MIIGERILEQIGTGQAHVAAEWLSPGHRVLELGCSTGYLTRRFAGKARLMYGLDMNAPALREAKRRNPGMLPACGSAEHLPFADATFDAVVMLEVIEHTASDAAAIRELRRVLKPGGLLILSTPHAGLFAWLDPYNVRRTVQQRAPLVATLTGRLARFSNGQFTDNLDWHRHYRVAELRRLLHPSFAVRGVYRGGFWLYPVAAATISVVGRLWNNQAMLRTLFQLLNWDFRLRAGPLSYNVMLLAERLPPPQER
ncbi:MAG TPA: class I SAM-dependent methyltransferase [Nitrospira sp.]|nr:class I SAM-dependent methyltransferase [Nitrospira sp.]